jgi:hypothetical protein
MNLIAVTLANKRNWDLDMVDGLIVSQRQSQIAEQFEGTPRRRATATGNRCSYWLGAGYSGKHQTPPGKIEYA